jgi:hypothetical protein
MKVKKAKLLWICLFLLPLGVLILAVCRHHRRQPYVDAANSVQLVRYKQFSDKWSALPFVPIVRSPEFEENINSISINNSNLLSPNQLSQLHKSMYNWIFAFHDGTYQSFHDFRVPVPSFRLKESLQDFMKQSGKTFPKDSEGVLKAYWNSYCVDVWTNYWRELNLTHSYVELQETNVVLPNLDSYVKTTDSMGVSETGPMLDFNETPSTILTNQESIIYATVCIVPKTKGATFPVFCRFYWSTNDSTWLPEYMATAYIGPNKLILLF